MSMVMKQPAFEKDPTEEIMIEYGFDFSIHVHGVVPEYESVLGRRENEETLGCIVNTSLDALLLSVAKENLHFK